jgi:hypothetical protein
VAEDDGQPAADPVAGPPVNKATAVGDVLWRGMDDRSLEVRRIATPGVEARDSRPLVGGGLTVLGVDELATYVDGMFLAMDATQAVVRWEHVATRGDRRCLTRVEMASELVEGTALQVVEVDGDGMLTRLDYFELDQLEAALARLDEWHREGEGSGP